MSATVRLTVPEQFSTSLRWLRERSGITQSQLGQAINLSRSSISHYEAGMFEPTLGSMLRLLGALGYELAIVPKAQSRKPVAITTESD